MFKKEKLNATQKRKIRSSYKKQIGRKIYIYIYIIRRERERKR